MIRAAAQWLTQGKARFKKDLLEQIFTGSIMSPDVCQPLIIVGL